MAGLCPPDFHSLSGVALFVQVLNRFHARNVRRSSHSFFHNIHCAFVPSKVVIRPSRITCPASMSKQNARDYMLEVAPKSRRIVSYVLNMIAALGTTRSMCGTRPPYSATNPSSAHTIRKHWMRPVYLSFPFSRGVCLRRVRTT